MCRLACMPSACLLLGKLARLRQVTFGDSTTAYLSILLLCLSTLHHVGLFLQVLLHVVLLVVLLVASSFVLLAPSSTRCDCSCCCCCCWSSLLVSLLACLLSKGLAHVLFAIEVTPLESSPCCTTSGQPSLVWQCRCGWRIGRVKNGEGAHVKSHCVCNASDVLGIAT